MPGPRTDSSVVVVIPAHNERETVAGVTRGLVQAIPHAVVVVGDNASTDGTADAARSAGACVIFEGRKGKGNVMRRLFADVDADCYLMIDGDATYDPAVAPELARLVLEDGVDMALGRRVSFSDGETRPYRQGHAFGNRALTAIFNRLFGLPIEDTLTGYRALSRRFVKSFPTTATGFEIETDLNVHAASLGAVVAEIPTTYVSRPEGSESKLRTYRDGLRILRRNLRLFRDARPNLAFSLLAIPWFLVSIILLVPPVVEYLELGKVLKIPSLMVGTGALVVGVLLIISGMILERVARNRVEACRLVYLQVGLPRL